MSKVLIVGYYNRGNLGDDMFEYALRKYIFDELYINGILVNVEFVNIDDVTEELLSQARCIFFGPGDVMNDYFLNKLDEFDIQSKIPVYALGTGFPFPSVMTCENLCKFDYITHRNTTDTEKLGEIMGECRFEYTPDLTWFIRNDRKIAPSTIDGFQIGTSITSKKVGVCLTRTMFDPDHPERYNNIVDKMGMFLAELVQNTNTLRGKWNNFSRRTGCARGCCGLRPVLEYEIYLMPFYCHPDSPQSKPLQDDRIIVADVERAIKTHLGENSEDLFDAAVHTIECQLEYSAIKSVFEYFDFVIANRFHSHVFSAITHTPFVSISTTRKVELLVKELNLEDEGLSIKLKVDTETDYPVDLPLNKLRTAFHNIVSNRSRIQRKLKLFDSSKSLELEHIRTTIGNLIYYAPKSRMSDEEYLERAKKCATRLKTAFSDQFENITEHELLHTPGILGQHIQNIQSEKDCATQTIIYTLLQERITNYNYGLMEQILGEDYVLFDSCKWILEYNLHHHHPVFDGKLLQNKIPFENRKLDISSKYNLSSYHRSGWGYVTQNLLKVTCLGEYKCISFDPYLDKTFGWDCEFLTRIGVLPFTQKWTGVFHHTPTPNYGLYTLDKTFQRQQLLDSLRKCTKLFVFSHRLKEWIDAKLVELGHSNHIQVIVLKHPTEFVERCQQFRPRNLLNNPNRKVVQIGAWLRDTFAIYKLKVPSNYEKIALKGKGMGHYYIDNCKFEEIEGVILELGNDEEGAICCQSHTTGGCGGCGECDECKYRVLPHNSSSSQLEHWKINKYVKGFVQTMKEMYSAVTLLERLTNDEYDELLTKNIVFIYLVDGSAINTLIECIVRNTPILINRIPAVEEYIGEQYPFFYDSIDDVYDILNSDLNIYRAYGYLQKLNKSDLRIEVFLQKLIEHFEM